MPPASRLAPMSGSVIRRTTRHGDAPRLAAARARCRPGGDRGEQPDDQSGKQREDGENQRKRGAEQDRGDGRDALDLTQLVGRGVVHQLHLVPEVLDRLAPLVHATVGRIGLDPAER